MRSDHFLTVCTAELYVKMSDLQLLTEFPTYQEDAHLSLFEYMVRTKSKSKQPGHGRIEAM